MSAYALEGKFMKILDQVRVESDVGISIPYFCRMGP